MTIRRRRLLELFMCVLLVGSPLLAAVAFGEASEGATRAFARTEGRWVVDEQGRVLMLHGVNLSGSAKSFPFMPWTSKDEVMALRKWGFNSVRYLMVWEAVEPQPGQYDDAYLDRVAERLEWCREAGLKVILDMHQDLYARKYGADGAPDWACLDDGQPHQVVPGAWFMTYFSPAVMRAFDNFYANKPGPGGVGIQDRYIAMWQHVAQRFRDDTNVIGYDLMNEPSYGKALMPVMASIIAAAAQELGPESGAKLAGVFTNPDDAFVIIADALQEMTEKGSLFRVLDAAGAPARDFEKKILQGFHDRLATALRQVDPNHIIVFETPMGDMSGTRVVSALEPPKGADGKPLPNTIFSPHFYDFSRDFDFPYTGTVDYLRQFLNRAVASGDAMGVPTWFGEWGIWTDQARPDSAALAKDHVDALNQLLCGWAYWDYSPAFKDFSFLPFLTEPYAQVVAGIPTRMQTTGDTFELEFTPQASGGETVIWVPLDYAAAVEVAFDGAGTAQHTRGDDGCVRVVCSPGAGPCTVTVALSRKP